MLNQLFKAITAGNIPTIEALLPQITEAELCTQNPTPAYNKRTALHMAIRAPRGTVDTIVALLIAKAPGLVNIPNGEGRTPIHGATGSGLLEATRCLINAGASLTVLDTSEQSILHWIAKCPVGLPVEVLQLCLAALKTQIATPTDWHNFINQQTAVNKSTALHAAAASALANKETNDNIALMLLQAGCDPTIKDSTGKLPIFSIQRYSLNFIELVELYTQQILSPHPLTALEQLRKAVLEKNLDAVKEILSTHSDLNLLEPINDAAETILFSAIRANVLEIVRALVEHCPALVIKPDTFGNYPLMTASNNQASYDICEYLALKEPALLKIVNQDNQTVLYAAASACHQADAVHQFEKLIWLHKRLLSPEDYKTVLNTTETQSYSTVLAEILCHPAMVYAPESSQRLTTLLLTDGAALTSTAISIAIQIKNYGAQIAMVLHASKHGTLISLVERGISVDVTFQTTGPYDNSPAPSFTALYYAARENNVVAVTALLAHKANPDQEGNSPTLDGAETPIDAALEIHNTEVLQLLLPRSSMLTYKLWEIAFKYLYAGQPDTTLVDTLLAHPRCNKTEALCQAVRYSYHNAYVEKLLTMGVDVNAISHGRTALHEAASAHNTEAIKQLIALGANVTLKDNEFKTPCERYKQMLRCGKTEDPEIVTLLSTGQPCLITPPVAPILSSSSEPSTRSVRFAQAPQDIVLKPDWNL